MVVNIGPRLPLPKCLQSRKSSMLKKKTEPSLVKCTECEFCCRTNFELNRHMKKHILKILTCPKCSHKCTDPLTHEAHVVACGSSFNNFSPQPPPLKNGFHSCRSCVFKFRSYQNLVVHERQHSESKGFRCYLCEIYFLSTDALREHYSKGHQNSVRVFACAMCDFNTIGFYYFKYHMVIHNSDKQLFCTKCRINAENHDEYKEHLNVVHKRLSEELIQKKGKDNVGERNMKDEHINKENNHSALKSAFESEVIFKDNSYSCNGCIFKFKKLENLAQHKKCHLNLWKPYRCYVCVFESFSVSEFVKHVKTHGIKIVKCNKCDSPVSADVWRVKRHAVNHLNDGLYCKKCQYNLEDSKSFEKHILSKHPELRKVNTYVCSKCDFHSTTCDALKIHKDNHCRKQMNTSGLIEEENAVNDDQKLQSKETIRANKSITKISQLNSLGEKSSPKNISMVNEVKENLFKCKICIKPFGTEGNLKAHSKSHQSKTENKQKINCSTRVFKCDKCDFKCSYKNMYEKHTLLHTEKKPVHFTCTVCQFQISLMNDYIQHVREHTGRIIYSCCYCSFISKVETNFLQHVTNHKFLDCPMCVFKTKHIEHLEGHIARQHTPGTGSYNCSMCPYSSHLESSLSLHCIKFHPTEFLKFGLRLPKSLTMTEKTPVFLDHCCKMCSFKTRRSYDLKRHMLKHYVNGRLRKNIKVRRLKSCITKKLPSQKKILVTNGSADSCIKLPKTDADGSSDWYRCSQCEYKRKAWKSVKRHLLSIHNINGGVRNHMIVRFKENINALNMKNEEYQLSSQNTGVSTNVHVNIIKNEISKKQITKVIEIKNKSDKTKQIAKKAVNKSRKGEKLVKFRKQNNETKINQSCELQKKKNPVVINRTTENTKSRTNEKNLKAGKGTFKKCSSCKIHLLSRIAQIDHKKLGHCVFWNKVYFCPKPRCGVRFTSKGSLRRHKSKHSNITMLICEICRRYKTYRRDRLKYHSANCLKVALANRMSQATSTAGGNKSPLQDCDEDEPRSDSEKTFDVC